LAVFSTVFLSVGSGLFSLLQPGNSAGEWAGFQVVGGIGSGAGLQVVRPSCQKKKKKKEAKLVVTNKISTTGYYSDSSRCDGRRTIFAMAFLVFSQSLAPAIALTLYNVVFAASLKAQLAQNTLNLSAPTVL
jgi:hypothetical protein